METFGRIDAGIFVAVLFQHVEQFLIIFFECRTRIFRRAAINMRAYAVVFYAAFFCLAEKSVEIVYSILAV